MKKIVPVALSVSLVFGPMGIAPVLAACVPIQGKLLNNGFDATTTLGVAALVYGSHKSGTEKKLKCAVWGTRLSETELTFRHVLSCDDELLSPDGRPIHSRLVLNTTGAFTGGGADFLTFAETSTPIPLTGGGQFFGVTGAGKIHVTGTVFLLTGAIDMNLSGEVCTD